MRERKPVLRWRSVGMGRSLPDRRAAAEAQHSSIQFSSAEFSRLG